MCVCVCGGCVCAYHMYVCVKSVHSNVPMYVYLGVVEMCCVV